MAGKKARLNNVQSEHIKHADLLLSWLSSMVFNSNAIKLILLGRFDNELGTYIIYLFHKETVVSYKFKQKMCIEVKTTQPVYDQFPWIVCMKNYELCYFQFVIMWTLLQSIEW